MHCTALFIFGEELKMDYIDDDNLDVLKKQIVKLILKINDPQTIKLIFNMVNKKYIDQGR